MNTEQNHRDKARADAVFQELRETFRKFAVSVNSRQMVSLSGMTYSHSYVEHALLAERILNDLGLTPDPDFVGAGLYVHDDLPPTDPVYIGDLETPKSEEDFCRLSVHVVHLLERIARDSCKVESLRRLLQDDVDRGTQAAGMLRMIVKFSAPGGA